MAKPKTSNRDNIKILSVVWYKVLPPKFGGQKAIALFNEHLAGHLPLVCLCSKNNETTQAVYTIRKILPVSKWQFLNPFIWRKIYRTTKKEQITHIVLEFPYHGIAGFFCKKLLDVKLITNTHNIEFLRFKQQKKWWWRPLFYFERWVCRISDAIFFKTEEDKEMAQEYFRLNSCVCEVVPYGVEAIAVHDRAYAKKIIRKYHNIAEDEKILLFAGTLDYKPNADAVANLVKKVIPILNRLTLAYKVIVCGRNQITQFQYLRSIEDDRLIFTGEVQNIDSYFSAADVFINPVLTGGGIQTKTMDALSYHLNVVCFASKATGIIEADNKLFSAKDNDWEQFSSAIVKALNSPATTSLSFFETYNWRTIAAKAFQTITSL